MGLGGAYTALADEPSGLYFNPAGIADVDRTNIQLSTNLYGFESGVINSDAFAAPVPGLTSFNINFTNLIIVPASAGFVTGFGPPGDDGTLQQAYGLAVTVPSYRSYAALSSGDTGSYQRHVTDRELWAGAGYGRKFGDHWRFGLSVYYVLRTLSDREDVTSQSTLASGGQKFESITNDIEVVTGSAVALLGAKFILSPAFSFGAAVQLPSVNINSQASLAFSRAAGDPSAASGLQSTFQQLNIATEAQTRYAPLVRLGAAYIQPNNVLVVADVSVHLPTHYVLVQVDPQYLSRVPFNPDVTRQTVANFNLGVEKSLIREVRVAAGVFSDFSSAPAIPSAPSVDLQPYVNLSGLTASLSYLSEHTVSRMGLVYSFGDGYDVIPVGGRDTDNILNPAQAFSRVSYFQSFFYFFLSSTFRY